MTYDLSEGLRDEGSLMNLVSPSADEVDVRYRALVDVASALTSHSELPDLLLSLRGHLEPLIQFTFLVVSLWDRDTDTIVVRFFEPYDSPASRLVGTSYPSQGTYPGMAVHSGRPVYVSPVQAGGPYPSDVLAQHGVESYCAVPLATARGTLGSLNFGSLAREAYTPEDIDFMVRVAKLVAVAVENAMSLEKVREQQTTLRRERDQLDLLLDVTNAVVTQLDTSTRQTEAVSYGITRRISSRTRSMTSVNSSVPTILARLLRRVSDSAFLVSNSVIRLSRSFSIHLRWLMSRTIIKTVFDALPVRRASIVRELSTHFGFKLEHADLAALAGSLNGKLRL